MLHLVSPDVLSSFEREKERSVTYTRVEFTSIKIMRFFFSVTSKKKEIIQSISFF